MKNNDDLKHNSWAPVTAIDKALAITPLFTTIIDGYATIEELLNEFEKEFIIVREYAIKVDEYSNRTQARLCYLVAALISHGKINSVNSDVHVSDIIINSIEKMRAISASANDFNVSMPLENGFWGVEVASGLNQFSQNNEFLRDNFDLLTLTAAEALNNISVLITEKDEMLLNRTKNSVSRFVSQQLISVLENSPKNSDELNQCLKSFKNIIDSFYTIVEKTRKYEVD